MADHGALVGAGPRQWSVAIGRDHLAAGLGPQRPVRLDVNRPLYEVDAAVREQHVGAAGMVAVGVFVIAIGSAPARGTQLAPSESVLGRTRRYDRVEKAHAPLVPRPP